jgi:ribosomal protein S18 acetylase RimI-like enzyme
VELSITTARSDDADEVVELDRRVLGSVARQQWLRARIAQGACVVARSAGHLMGFAVSDRSFFEQPFLELLIVEPAGPRRGVVSSLVRHVEAIWAPGKFFTSTNASNAPMQRLLDSLGYAPSGMIENLDENDPELIYYKRLG